jgi:DNA mismatch repair protein MutS
MSDNKEIPSIGKVVERWLRRRKAAQTILHNHGSESDDSQEEYSEQQQSDPDEVHSPPAQRAISLLWPPEAATTTGSQSFRLSSQASRDLGVASLTRTLEPDTRVCKDVEATLTNMVTDIPTLEYRLDILDDFVENTGLVVAFEQLVPVLVQVFQRRAPADDANKGLFSVAWRLGELENYLEALHIIHKALANSTLSSSALCALRDDTSDQLNNETYKHLEKELPQLLSRIRGARSLSLGINLSPDMLPSSATIISVNKTRFVDTPLLRTLFGKSSSGGIVKIHNFEQNGGRVTRPLMTPLFRDLSEVMSLVSRDTSNALEKFARITTLHMDALRGEVLFYLAAVRCVRSMRSAGLPMCRPTFRPTEDRCCVALDAYNINLAYEIGRQNAHRQASESVVTSNVKFDADGRILILTGPNSGGKTVYARTVGLVHVMAQTGMYVPAEKAEISPVDGVFTHFAVEEQISSQTGRLGDETKRLAEIVEHVTDHSLVILNESLSSTSHTESVLIAEDFLHAMSMLGARVIYTTHLHDLAARAEETSRMTPGKSRMKSLVALAEKVESEDAVAEVHRLYKIVPGLPQGRSYALEIARQHGMSLEQIVDTLKSRGVIDGDSQ